MFLQFIFFLASSAPEKTRLFKLMGNVISMKEFLHLNSVVVILSSILAGRQKHIGNLHVEGRKVTSRGPCRYRI